MKPTIKDSVSDAYRSLSNPRIACEKLAIVSKTVFVAIMVMMATSFIPVLGLADPYIGGQSLTTDNGTYGVITGDVWFDATPPEWPTSPSNPNYVDKVIDLPDNISSVEWARLYVVVYSGNMTARYHGNATIKADWTTDGSYDQTWDEDFNVSYSYPGTGGSGTVIVNDHCNRVTSDYIMWYDVKNNITNDATIKVNVTTQRVDDGTYNPPSANKFDGRIKDIVLIVAYNTTGGNTTYYWINQGHDVCSKTYEDMTGNPPFMGNTTFSTSIIPDDHDIRSVELTSIYLASANGYYNLTVGGNYDPDTSIKLEKGYDIQGRYAGVKTWDITSNVSNLNIKTDDITFHYQRDYSINTGYNTTFKIPLAILEVHDP